MTEQQRQVAHLAGKVMGWELRQSADGRRMEAWVENKLRILWSPRGVDRFFLFCPFVRIADAMELLDTWRSKLPTEGWLVIISPDGYYLETTDGERLNQGDGPTSFDKLPGAICNCLLKATGWKETA